jgi:hypothetical protein
LKEFRVDKTRGNGIHDTAMNTYYLTNEIAVDASRAQTLCTNAKLGDDRQELHLAPSITDTETQMVYLASNGAPVLLGSTCTGNDWLWADDERLSDHRQASQLWSEFGQDLPAWIRSDLATRHEGTVLGFCIEYGHIPDGLDLGENGDSPVRTGVVLVGGSYEPYAAFADGEAALLNGALLTSMDGWFNALPDDDAAAVREQINA